MLPLVVKRILRSDFFSLISGSILAQLVTLMTLPIITRIFAPADIGLISVFIAFITIPNALALLKLEGVILIKQSFKYVLLLWPAFLFTMTAVSVLSIVFFSAAYYFSLFGINRLPLWSLILIPFFIFSSGIALIVKSRLVFNLEYKKFALFALIRNITNAILKIVGGFISSNFFSLILAELISTVSFFYELKRVRKWRFNRSIRKSFFKYSIKTLKKWKRFSITESFSLLLDQLSQILPLLLIAHYLGPVSVGLFTLAYKITFLPGTHLSASYSEIFKGSFGQLVRIHRYNDARDLVLKTFKKCFITAILFFVPIFFFAPSILPIVFGYNWVNAGDLIQIIVPWATTSFISSTLSPVFSIIQKQHLKLFYDITALALTIILVFIFNAQSLTEFVSLVSIANVISNIIYFFLINYSIKQFVLCAESEE